MGGGGLASRGLPRAFAERSRRAQVALAALAPAALGALSGLILGLSAPAYWALQALAATGALLAGLEHRGSAAAARRGLLGGAVFGGSLLLAHAASGLHEQASLARPHGILVLASALIGAALGVLGAALRRRAERPGQHDATRNAGPSPRRPPAAPPDPRVATEDEPALRPVGRARVLARVLAVAAVLATAAAVALLLSSGGSYEVTAEFIDAGQLVKGDQVHLGAAPVGSVSDIRLENDGTVAIRLRLTGPADPLPQGTIARIRLDSLSGVANRYVSLDEPLVPHGTVADGGVLPTTQTQSPVDLDVLFDAFDAPTRRGLREVIRGSAQQYDRRAAEARATLEQLGPALAGSGEFARQFTRDRVGFVKLLRDGAVATTTLSLRRGRLTDLIDKAERTTRALGAERSSLADALVRLPRVLRHGSRTLASVRSTLDVVAPLVEASKPSAPRLPGFLDRLDAVFRLGRPTLGRLASTIRGPGPRNDLIDLLSAAPALDRLSRTAFPRAIRTIAASRRQLADLLAYTPDVIGALAHLGQVTANYDADGHYVRLQPDLLAFVQNPATNTLSPGAAGQALATLPTRSGARCPGDAIARPGARSSRPVRGCDPAAGGRTP